MNPLALSVLLLTLICSSCYQMPPNYAKPLIVPQPPVQFPGPPAVAVVNPNSDSNLAPNYGYPQGSYPNASVDPNNPDAAFNQVAQQYAQEASTQAQQSSYYPQAPAQNAIAAPYNPQVIEQPTTDSNLGVMDYKVKITNGTPSRIFIEAQDAAGNIYPCGAMAKGQSQTTAMTQSAPAKGPILIVVRDPDQPGAPELRRYRVATPTTSYANRTLHITIIPKGRYSAAVDDEVYYLSASED